MNRRPFLFVKGSVGLFPYLEGMMNDELMGIMYRWTTRVNVYYYRLN